MSGRQSGIHLSVAGETSRPAADEGALPPEPPVDPDISYALAHLLQALVRQSLEKAYDNGVPANPSTPPVSAQPTAAEPPVLKKAKKHELPKFVSREEAAGILGAISRDGPVGIRDRCMFELMYRAGLRIGEVCALGPRDVDLVRGEVKVAAGKTGDRTAWFDPATVSPLIEEWKRERRRLGLAKSPYLFCTVKRTNTRLGGAKEPGRPVNPFHLETKIKRLAKDAGLAIDWVTPHKLRHTFATEVLEETGNVRKVQKLLGHRNLGTTEIYTHIVDTDLRATMHKRSEKRLPVKRRKT